MAEKNFLLYRIIIICLILLRKNLGKNLGNMNIRLG